MTKKNNGSDDKGREGVVKNSGKRNMAKESIGSYEAKTRLPEILRMVQEGASFTITNRGKPVADLLPSEDELRQKTASAIKNIIGMKSKRTVSDELLRDYKENGRK